MTEQFISETIEFSPATANASPMVAGEPGLPRRFVWRRKAYDVDEVLEKWTESGPCRNGSGEMYLRKHWYAIKTTTGERMKLYFERQPRSKQQRRARWWLYTVCV